MKCVVTIRDMVRGDADAYRALLEAATDQERYFRYFRPVHEVDAALIEAAFAPGAIGLLAEDEAGRPLGAAHGFLDERARRADFAILVAPSAQHAGVGKHLVTRLIEELFARGCRCLVARSLDGNEKFSGLARAVGMHVAQHGHGVLTWELPLEQPLVDA